MDFQKLDPRAKKMWRTSRMIGLVILAAGFAVSVYLIDQSLRPSHLIDLMPLAILGLGVPVILQFLNFLIYPLVEYRQWAYLITPDRIEIRKGLFFHSIRIVPISRIQHVTVSEGPIARAYHLASVTINTAGGSMKIEGLARETAEEICNNLKTIINRKIQGVQTPAGG